MKPLFNINKLKNEKPCNKVAFKCELCGKNFAVLVKFVRASLKKGDLNRHRYCSNKCRGVTLLKKITTNCKQCLKPLNIKLSDFKKSKSGNSFCSKSCAAIYNNTNKTTGNRRSKLEVWLEQELTKTYPTLDIKYNDKKAIKSELDIWIPSINLAFELNGIFHYKPIYGQNKLISIQNNDNKKIQACLNQQIELVIIDSSSLKYFKPKNVIKYYNIICNKINLRLGDG